MLSVLMVAELNINHPPHLIQYNNYNKSSLNLKLSIKTLYFPIHLLLLLYCSEVIQDHLGGFV